MWRHGAMIKQGAILLLGAIILLVVAMIFWLYISLTIPIAIVPPEAVLFSQSQWSVNHATWRTEKYTVNVSPEEVRRFYAERGIPCSFFYRRYIEKEKFLFSCSGRANPKGTFSVEVGQPINGEIDRHTVLVVEISWGDE